jgi:3,4-dihydroxy 2-butanone 4-phosphate synthase/GTP cyclohydrolase II
MAHDTAPSDLVRPGHVFPLRARPRGVLERRGQTEASVDLTRMARLRPGGVLCEVMNDDGTMARGPQLAAFCRRHSLPLVTVDQIAVYRRQAELAVTAV